MSNSNLPPGCLSGDIEPNDVEREIDVIRDIWLTLARINNPEPMIKAMADAQQDSRLFEDK